MTFTLTWALLLSEEILNQILAERFFGGIKTFSAIFVIVIFLPIKDLMHKVTDKVFPHDSHHKNHELNVEDFKKLPKY